VVVAHLK